MAYKYFPTGRDLPDTGMIDVQRMAPDAREISTTPGANIALSAGVPIQVLPINRLRRYAAVSNVSLTEPVYIKLGPPTGHVVGAGIMLVAPAGSIVLGLNTDIPHTGEVSAVSTNASAVSVIEG